MNFHLEIALRGKVLANQSASIPLQYPSTGESISLRATDGSFVGPYKVVGVHHLYTDREVTTTVHLSDGP